jgi:glycosyltransferase involved in cell wall biosynthesis
MGFAERPVWAVVRKAHQQAQVNLAASEAAREELEAQRVRDVRVWQGGVDLERFHPSHAHPPTRARMTGGDPDRRLCLYVGRLAAEKGLERLLPLAAPDSGRHLALVGDGPARAELERTFAGTAATFTGPLAGRELARAYASADVFVFPSTTDTLGLVLLEAMASGLPVAAARAPATRDLLQGAPAASLFDGDDATGLVAATERWLDQPVDRLRVAEAARRQVVTWQRSTDQLLDAYESALGRVGRRAA